MLPAVVQTRRAARLHGLRPLGHRDRPSRPSSSTSPGRTSANDRHHRHRHADRRSPARTGTPSPRRAFGALLLRDLTVLRKNLKEFIPRTLLQPFLLVFVFTYVFPKIGQGVGGSGAAAAEFSTVLVAGVVGLAIMFQGIQSVALPMVQEFGYTREIEDRVLAPAAGVAGRDREGRRRRAQGPVRRAARVPDRRGRAGHAGAPRHQLAGAAHADPARLLHVRRARPDVRHPFDPRTVPMLFGIDRHPAHVPRLHLLLVVVARADPLAAGRRAGQPARLHVRGLPGRAHPGAAHEPAGPSTR